MTFCSSAEQIIHEYIFITAEPALEIVKQGALSSCIVPLCFIKINNLGACYFLIQHGVFILGAVYFCYEALP